MTYDVEDGGPPFETYGRLRRGKLLREPLSEDGIAASREGCASNRIPEEQPGEALLRPKGARVEQLGAYGDPACLLAGQLDGHPRRLAVRRDPRLHLDPAPWTAPTRGPR